MSDTRQRTPKYKRRAEAERKPIRLNSGDAEILKLFGPGRFTYLTAEIIAAITGRPVNRVQHRLRELFDHAYLVRYFPPYAAIGGSAKAVYLLDAAGARIVSEAVDKPVKAPKFDPEEYHPFLEHTLAVNWFRGLVLAACTERKDIDLRYQYLDREFVFRFKVKIQDREISSILAPDWFLGIGQSGQPVKNFCLEIQRSSRKTKEPTRDDEEARTLRDKFRDYYFFYKKREAFEAAARNDYPDIENLANMRVLVVTDTSDKEHEHLIELARSVDEKKVGLRMFYFARKSDFDLRRPETLFAPVWRTPVEGDELRSIFG